MCVYPSVHVCGCAGGLYNFSSMGSNLLQPCPQTRLPPHPQHLRVSLMPWQLPHCLPGLSSEVCKVVLGVRCVGGLSGEVCRWS